MIIIVSRIDVAFYKAERGALGSLSHLTAQNHRPQAKSLPFRGRMYSVHVFADLDCLQQGKVPTGSEGFRTLFIDMAAAGQVRRRTLTPIKLAQVCKSFLRAYKPTTLYQNFLFYRISSS